MKKYLNLTVVVILFASLVPARSYARAESPAHAVYEKLLKIFPVILPNATDQSKDALMQELLGTTQPSLSYPAFPRTWVEMSLITNQDSSTSYSFSTQALSKVLPLSIIPGLSTAVKAGVGIEFNTNYRYSINSTFIAMTSLRRLNPEAKENSKEPYSEIVSGQPRNELRSIIHWDATNKRTYFKVDKDYPMLGLCKFDMTLQISTTKKGNVDFLIGSHSESDEEVQTVSYSVYSNFFQIESHVPTQDYLRIKCKENFSYAVRYIVETDFNKVVADYFAHNHPKAQCVLPEGAPNPKGDESCNDWFKSMKVAGYYRQFTVPRCVLNVEGIPTCVARGKPETRCPLYWEDSELVASKPGRTFDSFNYASKDDTKAFYCDKGLKCLPPGASSLREYQLGLGEKIFGIDSRCRK